MPDHKSDLSISGFIITAIFFFGMHNQEVGYTIKSPKATC